MHAACCLTTCQDSTAAANQLCRPACVAQSWSSKIKQHQTIYLYILLQATASIDRLQPLSCLQQQSSPPQHKCNTVLADSLIAERRAAHLGHIATRCCYSSHAIIWYPMCIHNLLQACPVVPEQCAQLVALRACHRLLQTCQLWPQLCLICVAGHCCHYTAAQCR